MADTTPTPNPADDNQPASNYSEQDKLIVAYVADAEKFIETASTDEEISAILAEHGYDAEEFAEGTALAEAASEAIAGRASGMGKQSDATKALNVSIKAARADSVKFRIIARACFTGDAERTALSLKGDLPDDTGRFITTARTGYTVGKQEPYATKLAKRGYKAEKLDALLAALNALTKTGSTQDKAQGDAVDNTVARDTAYDALRAWMKELKGVCRGALRGKAGLKAKLEL